VTNNGTLNRYGQAGNLPGNTSGTVSNGGIA